ALLDGFKAHLRQDDSLCFFYAKHVPFVEGTGRILVGAGRIRDIGDLTEFKREGDGPRGMVWERPVQHSIRPKESDGFLLPYHEILRLANEDPTLDSERFAAKAPDEHWDEFSYASELVTHDGAIASLLVFETTLNRIQKELGLPTNEPRQWLHDELVRLWKVRGPFPGLGAVLTAFGLSRGLFVAHALQHKAGENADPWTLVDAAFRDPGGTMPAELSRDLRELAPTWTRLPTERRAYLTLLSRFELTAEQARALYDLGSRSQQGWNPTDEEILRNPYRIFEATRHDPDRVHLLTVDRGVFPDDAVRLLHPLETPSHLDSAVDLRRVRAFTVAALEAAADRGHALLPNDRVVEAILANPVKPKCPVTGDMLTARGAEMAPEIVPVDMESGIGFQLERYRSIGDLARTHVMGRLRGARHEIDRDWRALLEGKFGPSADPDEDRAREEKAAGLKEMSESRFSVLIGPAGTGKTTVMGVLCAQPELREGGVLLLAPTGKARVRLQELVGAGDVAAQTIAQFLNQYGRYDGRTARYHLSDRPKATGFGTVIVDEASMLTEDMLGALLDSLQGVKRLVLVGDPAQLPPIGAGRPFVDIIAKLRPKDHEGMFPRIAPGYAELTVERRQIGGERPDLKLARWFSGTPAAAGDDEVFCADANEHRAIRFVEWQSPEGLLDSLLGVLVEELELNDPNDIRGFNDVMGAVEKGDYQYFNANWSKKGGAVERVEAWQLLSPLRGMSFGVTNINRAIHTRFRSGFLELATMHPRSIPKPMGPERIVYGDKVINLSNHRRDGRKVYPHEGALGYLANGEIGIVVGQWKTKGFPKILKVEFASQRGYTYDFYESNFREESDPALELAYALTVHKAQGSQFGLVILVLPQAHPILSRELIYTAVTRHQDRVVIMHQGPRTQLKEFASPDRSDTARRLTNLLEPCRMVEFPQQKGSVFLQAGLVHRTSRGLAVRSKSELVIAEALDNAGVSFEYEKPLTLAGKMRYPDFTIEDDISGRTVYWEHLGMLEREDYRRSWDRKLRWYESNGIEEANDGSMSSRFLVSTKDSSRSGLDMAEVNRIIRLIHQF
ncbi:AAA family ATPase, partial [Gemmatimonadota bacterium]